jgi:DNA-binding transcriptional MerR regulator
MPEDRGASLTEVDIIQRLARLEVQVASVKEVGDALRNRSHDFANSLQELVLAERRAEDSRAAFGKRMDTLAEQVAPLGELAAMRGDLRELIGAARIGKSAWFIIVKVGAVVAALSAAAWWAWGHMTFRP